MTERDSLRTLTREELTAALAARQMLLERRALDPVGGDPAAHAAAGAGFARAVRRAGRPARRLRSRGAARRDRCGASREDDDQPADAAPRRGSRLSGVRAARAPGADAHVAQDVRAPRRGRGRRGAGGVVRASPARTTRSASACAATRACRTTSGASILFARIVLPLVQVPPAGYWAERRRPSFAVDSTPRPEPDVAAAVVLERYLAAFGPASRRDVASWAGVAQRDFAAAFDRVETVSFEDEHGVELFDLPGQPLPDRRTRRCPCASSRAGIRRCSPTTTASGSSRSELQPLKLTLSGDQTITVDGRVAASWLLKRSAKAVEVQHHAAPRDPPLGARRDPRGGASASPGSARPTPAASR